MTTKDRTVDPLPLRRRAATNLRSTYERMADPSVDPNTYWYYQAKSIILGLVERVEDACASRCPLELTEPEAGVLVFLAHWRFRNPEGDLGKAVLDVLVAYSQVWEALAVTQTPEVEAADRGDALPYLAARISFCGESIAHTEKDTLLGGLRLLIPWNGDFRFGRVHLSLLEAALAAAVNWGARVDPHLLPLIELYRARHSASMVPEDPQGDAEVGKYQRALDRIYGDLVKLEENLGEGIGTKENARLLHRSIESCKHRKQPEFDRKFGDHDRAEEGK